MVARLHGHSAGGRGQGAPTSTLRPPTGRCSPHTPGARLLRVVLLIVGLALIGKLIRFTIWSSTWWFAMAGSRSQPPKEPDADSEAEA
jgi:hypothetical protein